MSYTFNKHDESMHECPKCGKMSLNEVSDGHFRCIWCGFDRNIGDGESSYFGNFLGNVAFFAIAIFFVGVLIQPNGEGKRQDAHLPLPNSPPQHLAQGAQAHLS